MHDKHKPGLFGPFDSLSELFRGLLPDRRDPATVMVEALETMARPTADRYASSTDEPVLVLDVDLSGIRPQDVTLWVAGPVIIVKHPTVRGTATHRYTVSADYDTLTTEANMDAGRLRVRVSRARAAVPRRVAIEYVGRSGG